jgi:hypothetical protein
MFLITRPDGKFWDGYGWNVRGKVFCTIGGATRSLHEEGESPELTSILAIDSKENDTTKKFPSGDFETSGI